MDSNFEKFKINYDKINQSYWNNSLTESNLTKWHNERLKVVLEHVKMNSVFYKKHLYNINPKDISLKNLSSLPFTTKIDLRDSMSEILCGGLKDAIFYYETTGTTGPATPCPRDKKESYASNKQLAMSWQSIIEKHFPKDKPVVGIMGPTEVHSFGDTLGDVCYQLNICNAKLWPHSPVIGFPKSLQLLKSLNINILASSPGMLMALAKEAEKNGYNSFKDFNIKVFMMSGELCTPALKQNLYSLWNAEAYNSLYGSQESLIIAANNSDDRLIPHRLNYIIEVLNDYRLAQFSHFQNFEHTLRKNFSIKSN
jgi:phenylacetate-CoA ligase